MSPDQLVTVCQRLYDAHGPSALVYENLKKHKGLYWALYSNGLSQKKLVQLLGVENELKQYKREIRGWTWQRVVSESSEIVKKHSFLPPAGWFQTNGMSGLVYAVYDLGKTWADLRNELDSFEGSSFVESRNGLRWRSHPEASVSNFLYTRGIKHTNGRKYPPEYADESGQNYGYFDLAVQVSVEICLDIEIWGEKPNGHNEGHYARKRHEKEAFNANNKHFLGIEFRDCFVEDKLAKIFEPYIGIIEPYIFDKATDYVIPSTHWSNADELIDYCREFAAKQPDGKFPTEEWLRKRGKWSDRPGDAYNTLSVYIKLWLGGIRNLRKILVQAEHSTVSWDKESAVQAYKKFYEEHQLTPDQARHLYEKGDSRISEDTYKLSGRIANAVNKYAGGTKQLNEQLGIEIRGPRKWTREAILTGFREVIDQWGVSPRQLQSDVKSRKVQMPSDEYKNLGQMLDAVGRQFSGIQEVYDELGFTPPSRPRKRRSDQGPRKWAREVVLAEVQQVIDRWGLSLSQLARDMDAGKAQMTEDEYKQFW